MARCPQSPPAPPRASPVGGTALRGGTREAPHAQAQSSPPLPTSRGGNHTGPPGRTGALRRTTKRRKREENSAVPPLQTFTQLSFPWHFSPLFQGVNEVRNPYPPTTGCPSPDRSGGVRVGCGDLPHSARGSAAAWDASPGVGHGLTRPLTLPRCGKTLTHTKDGGRNPGLHAPRADPKRSPQRGAAVGPYGGGQ